jgi:hypothetical protein
MRPDTALGRAVEEAAREASTASFHLAMAVVAALFGAGAAVSWFGLRPGVQAVDLSDEDLP